MTPAPLLYEFLSDLSVTAPLEKVVDGVDQWVARYFHVCDLLYHKLFGKRTSNSELREYGEAQYLIERSVAAMVRGGLKFDLVSKDKDLVAWFNDWQAKNMIAAAVVSNETELALKGRSAILLEASTASKTIAARVLKAEYCWPQYDAVGMLTGYRLIWPLDDEQPGNDKQGRRYYQVEFATDQATGKTLRTSGKCIVKDGKLQYETYDKTPDGKKEMKRFPLDIDFLPVVHFDNVPQTDGLPVSQLHAAINALRALFRNNYDMDQVSATKGSPPLVVEGPDPTTRVQWRTARQRGSEACSAAGLREAGNFRVKPRTVLFTGQAGNRAYLLDTATALDALKLYDTILTDKILTVTHLTRIGAGMMTGNDWPRYESLAMAMQPLTDRVALKITTREPKYKLLARLALRYAVGRNFITVDQGKINALDVNIAWPEVVPANRQAERAQVLNEFEKGLVTQETALRVAAANGLRLDSVEAEMQRFKDSQPDFTE